MWFHVAVVWNLFRSRTSSAARMMIVAFIAALWCVGGFVWTLATWRDLDRQAADVRVEIVMKISASELAAKSIVRDLRRMPSMREVTIIYPQQMWQEFSSELSVSEELQAVVMLPTIVRFRPAVANVNGKWLSMVGNSISSMYTLDIEKVIWPADYVNMIDARRMDITMFGGAAGILSLFVFLIALQYAFRAELLLAARDLKVMSSLGASPFWSAAPHFMFGLTCGAVGFAFAIGGFLIVRPYLLGGAAWLSTVTLVEILALTAVLSGIGVIFAFIQSLTSARKSYRLRGTY